jgi:hypothetical protein
VKLALHQGAMHGVREQGFVAAHAAGMATGEDRSAEVHAVPPVSSMPARNERPKVPVAFSVAQWDGA